MKVLAPSVKFSVLGCASRDSVIMFLDGIFLSLLGVSRGGLGVVLVLVSMYVSLASFREGLSTNGFLRPFARDSYRDAASKAGLRGLLFSYGKGPTRGVLPSVEGVVGG